MLYLARQRVVSECAWHFEFHFVTDSDGGWNPADITKGQAHDRRLRRPDKHSSPSPTRSIESRLLQHTSIADASARSRHHRHGAGPSGGDRDSARDPKRRPVATRIQCRTAIGQVAECLPSAAAPVSCVRSAAANRRLFSVKIFACVSVFV